MPWPMPSHMAGHVVGASLEGGALCPLPAAPRCSELPMSPEIGLQRREVSAPDGPKGCWLQERHLQGANAHGGESCEGDQGAGNGVQGTFPSGA